MNSETSNLPKFGYHFQDLRLTNIIYLQKARLDLDYSGITVVKGWNKNAKGNKRVTNGAGKSLLLSAIPNLVLNSMPAITSGKRSSGTKGTLLTNTGSKIKLKVLGQGVPYTVEKYKKGNGVKYTVHKGEKDLKLATPTKAEHYLRRKVFPLTESQFYTYMYLHGTRQFPLQMGTATERMAFFTEMFDLERFDLVREACVARKKALEEDRIRLKELKRQLGELESALGETNSKKLKKSIEQYTIQLDELNTQMAQLDQMRKDYIVYQQWKHDWDLVDPSQPFTDQLDLLKQKLGKMAGWEQEWKSWQQYLERKAAWTPGMEKAKKKIGNMTKIEAKHRLGKLKEQLRALEKEHAGLILPERPTEVEEIEVGPSEYGGKPTLDEALAHAVGERDRLNALIPLQKQINKINNSSGKCLICGTKGVKVKDHLQEYVEQHTRWSKAVTKILRAIKYKEYKKEIKRYKAKKEAYQQASKKIEQQISELDDPKKFQDIIDGHEWLEENPVPLFGQTEIKMPRTPVGSYMAPQEFDSAKMVRLQQKHDRLKRLLKAEPVLRRVAQRLAEHRKASEQHTVLQDQSNDTTAERATLNQVFVNYKQLKDKAVRLEQEIQDLRDQVSDLPVLEQLIDVYGKNGRKLQVMHQFAKQLEQRMNVNAPLIFPEPMTFEFTVATNSLSVVVTRGKGKEAKTSDVRFMSGAETKQFNLCLVSALIPMLPAVKRSNLIVLDEVDSGMNEAAAERFRNDFLPELQKIVPHVVVITPLDEQYPNARTITVVKEGNVSTVEHRNL